jgi:hypothetical protein
MAVGLNAVYQFLPSKVDLRGRPPGKIQILDAYACTGRGVLFARGFGLHKFLLPRLLFGPTQPRICQATETL